MAGLADQVVSPRVMSPTAVNPRVVDPRVVPMEAPAVLEAPVGRGDPAGRAGRVVIQAVPMVDPIRESNHSPTCPAKRHLTTSQEDSILLAGSISNVVLP